MKFYCIGQLVVDVRGVSETRAVGIGGSDFITIFD